MSRPVLDEAHIDPAIHAKVAGYHADIIDEVKRAIAENEWVVVGMRQNPHPKKAIALLTSRGLPYVYLEYGSYLGEWRRRSALKMWTGWPTFPMVFRSGVLLGGASELQRALEQQTAPA